MNLYVHQDTGDDARDGLSLATAWQSLKDSALRLFPDDTLHVARASAPYTDRIFTVRHGERGKPISIVTDDRAVIGGDGWQLDADWWNVQGFHAEGFTGVAVVVGHDRVAHHVNVTDFNFYHAKKPGIWLYYVEDISIIGCHLLNLRARAENKDRCGLLFKRTANRVLIEACWFQDFGSDGVHGLPNGYFGFCGNVLIDNCKFSITRPYGSVPWQDFSKNVGENGIDVKYVDGPWLIRDCEFHGFRPTVEGQDASGCGSGSAIRVHYEARNVIIERPRFYDCTTGIKANPNHGAFVGPITVIAPFFEDVEYPMIFEDVTGLTIEEEEPMGIVETLHAKAAELRAKAAEFLVIADELDGAAAGLVEADEKADELADLL